LLSYPTASFLFAFVGRVLRSWQGSNCGDESVKIGATKAERDINACGVSFSSLVPPICQHVTGDAVGVISIAILTLCTLLWSKPESQVTGGCFSSLVALHILAVGAVDVRWVWNKETICQRSITTASAAPAFRWLAIPASVSGIFVSVWVPPSGFVYEHISHAKEMTFSDHRNMYFR